MSRQYAKRGTVLPWVLAHVDHQGEGCLIWPFGKSKGYANMKYEGRTKVATNLMCELAHGKAPTPKHNATHSCGKGDQGCIHPGHLVWKTQKGNAQDMIEHGNAMLGSKAFGNKLPDEEVRQIRSLKGQLLQREIAKLFGVCQQLVSMIHRNERWKWLT